MTASSSASPSTHKDASTEADAQPTQALTSSMTSSRSTTSPPRFSALRHAAAGLTAGAVTTAVLHPLDLLKVRLQGRLGGSNAILSSVIVSY